MKQNYIIIALWLLLASVVATTFFFSRSVFLTSVDWNHLTDYVAHSQWAIPFSTRTISDNQLYAVAAHKLGQGMHPFLINPEVPPLGKYLYAASILTVGNPFFTSAVLYMGVLFLTFLISKTLTNRTENSLLATLLVALSPALFSQLSLTMLDLPLMFFFLLHVWAVSMLCRSTSGTDWRFLIIAACSLGAFAATKFPLFAPLLVVSSVVMLWYCGHIKRFFFLFFLAGLTFMATYSVYFLEGYSIVAWLRSLYWTVQFYESGTKEHLFFQLFPAFFTGSYTTTLSSTAQIVQEWTIWWPLIFIGSSVSVVYAIKEKKSVQQVLYLGGVTFLFVCVLSLLEFQARYVFLIIPLMTVLTVALIPLKKWVWVTLLILLSLQALFALRTQPSTTLVESQRMWQYGHYQDLYSFLTPGSPGVERRAFHEILTRQIHQNLGVKTQQVSIVHPTITPWQQLFADSLSAQAILTLNTEFGPLEIIHPLMLRRIQNHWYIDWDWHLYTSEFAPHCTLSYQIDPKPGKLISSDGSVLSQYQQVLYARLDLTNVPTTPSTFSALAQLLDIEDLQAENILQNTANGRLWLDLPFKYADVPKENALTAALTSHPLYRRVPQVGLSEKAKDMITELEAKYPEVSAPPPSILITSCNGNQTQKQIYGSRKDRIVPYKRSEFK